MVVNKRTHTLVPGDVYIGRGERWGNPFRFGGESGVSRDEAVEKHRAWLWSLIQSGAEGYGLEDLAALHGKTLVCFCAPEPCHGDTLERAAAWAVKQLDEIALAEGEREAEAEAWPVASKENCLDVAMRDAAVVRAEHQEFLAKMEAKHAEKRAEEQARRDFEGDVDALDLAQDGYFDVWYEEWVGSETVGPTPRWVVESTYTDHVEVRVSSLMRAIFCLIAGRTIPFILRGALRNAKIQLDEAWVVSDGFRDVHEMYDGTDDRDMGDDTMAWLHRDPSDKSILSRWNRPDDELEFMEQLREQGRESEWSELMTEFRRQKVHKLLQEYFGMDDYRASQIVLRWEKGSSGRWKPAKQMNAVEWVNWSIEQSGSILGGLQSVSLSLQKKIALRQRKQSNSKAAAKA